MNIKFKRLIALISPFLCLFCKGQSTYKLSDVYTYKETITWQGLTAPSGNTSHYQRWQQIGNGVWAKLGLVYKTNGSQLTQVQAYIPKTWPNIDSIIEVKMYYFNGRDFDVSKEKATIQYLSNRAILVGELRKGNYRAIYFEINYKTKVI